MPSDLKQAPLQPEAFLQKGPEGMKVAIDYLQKYAPKYIEDAKAGYEAIRLYEFIYDVEMSKWENCPPETQYKAIRLVKYLREHGELPDTGSPEKRYKNAIFAAAIQRNTKLSDWQPPRN